MTETNDPRYSAIVADDDSNFRFLIQQTLGKSGIDVIEAEHGKAALEAAESNSADIILLDISMPEMDGLDACVAIRKLDAHQSTPILMITGVDDIESIQKAYDAGATDFIAKPINWLLLGERVKFMIRAHQMKLKLVFNQPDAGDLIDKLPAWAGDDENAVLIDEDVIANLKRLEADADTPLLSRLVESYIQEMPSIFGAIHAAHQSNDKHALFEAIIKAKTKSDIVGARAMTQLAKELERFLHAGRLQQFPEIFDDMQRVFDRTALQLREQAK